VGPGNIVVEVGGVGFSVAVPATVLEDSPEAGQSISLYTRLIVRADSLSLYGFGSPEQRQLFESLAQSLGSEVRPTERGFLDWLKDALGG